MSAGTFRINDRLGSREPPPDLISMRHERISHLHARLFLPAQIPSCRAEERKCRGERISRERGVSLLEYIFSLALRRAKPHR